MTTKRLILFTSSFPYGEGEQFIETEILLLSDKFSKIYIFPLTIFGNERQVPENVEIIKPDLYLAYNRPKLLLKNFYVVVYIYMIQLFTSKTRGHYLKNFKFWFYYLLNRINDANWLDKKLDNLIDENTVIYSYWFNLWGTMLSIIKAKKGRKFNFFTRIHGGDFDEAQKKEGFFPFREFELKQVHQIYAVSTYGINYMKQRYGNSGFDISLNRLGVNNYGDNPFIPSKGYYQIVSCSFIYGLKRVNLIVDILSNIKDVEIKWTHFGSGELADEVLNYAKGKLGTNIEVDFKGLVQNKDIIEFYKTTPIDLFLNTSELEGIPVSMMEAISFGIPIVGCEICGVPEIVNGQTGLLIPKNFKPEEVATKVLALLTLNDDEALNKRKKVKEFWYQNFNGVSNYTNFVKLITN